MVSMTRQEYQELLNRRKADPKPEPPQAVESKAQATHGASDTPNKTEAAFGLHLKALYPGAAILFNKVKLRLAKKTWYAPDYMVITGTYDDPVPLFFEVKGFMRDDAAVKIKVAAEQNRWAKFYVVRKVKGGAWKVERVFP